MNKSELMQANGLDSLHAELHVLIAASRQRLASTVNAELSRLYWSVRQRLSAEVLAGARAEYGAQLMRRMGEKLEREFGRGFEVQNLRRMVQFVQAFSSAEIVATLSRQLSWSHFVLLIPLKTEAARLYYAQQSAAEHWSVRELRRQIERKAYERNQIASPEVSSASDAPPSGIFKDPYFFDFLGLRDGHDEEAPIGLILCAESSKEQVELLQVQKDGITVAEYWTELPPKAELERQLRSALAEARERLERRRLTQ